MTIIKYATIGHARTSDTLVVRRGKESGLIAYRPPEDEDATVFSDPIYAERVVELPEPMTPTEYDEYLETALLELDGDEPISTAYLEVASERGIES